MPKPFRYILFVVGVMLSIPLLLLLSLVPGTPVSPMGILYLLSYSLIILGLIFTPRLPQQASVSLLIGLVMAFVSVTGRILFPPAGTRMNLMTLPGPSGPRLLDRIFDEQDLVLFGSRVAPYLGAISSAEKKSLDRMFSQTFQEMRAEAITPLSPFLTTYLNQQSPDRFDIVVAEPGSGEPPKTGIIFLHGFGGNFTLPCWLVAKAGDQIGALTVCPSTGPVGAWWNLQGQSILQETLKYLHQRGVERIYLAGLSNGAIGASRLAAQFEQDVAGLILISGADPGARVTDLPVLLLHGKNDERIPASMMEAYASAAAPNAEYHIFESDHFLLLKQVDQVQEVIVQWLRLQERNRKT